MTALTAGFALSLSLILAIGAQNAFVLRQGLRGTHVFAVCLTCALSDAILIAAGVAGFDALVGGFPWLVGVMKWGGAIFLVVYGGLSFRAAFGPAGALDPSEDRKSGLGRTLITCLILTWGNPHVYLDTIGLLGSVSTQYDAALSFGIGAITASFVFFFSLGYGARGLRPLFARPTAWRVLDAGIGVTMWAIALGLVAS